MISSELAVAPQRPAVAETALKASAKFWFLVVLIGQWMFAYYILAFYGGLALARDWQGWSDRLIVGFIEGDAAGNAALVLHIALAFVVTFFGPLQFIPIVRTRAAGFHRWNGRVYVATALVISLGALYMVWTRGALDGQVGGLNAIGISLNAALIMIFAALTAHFAMARRIDIHQQWALRLFVAMSGVWFMRVGYGLWSFVHQGRRPPGVTGQLDGWFDVSLPYIATLFPLLVLELYLRAKHSNSPPTKIATASLISVLTIAMAAGILTFAERLAEYL